MAVGSSFALPTLGSTSPMNIDDVLSDKNLMALRRKREVGTTHPLGFFFLHLCTACFFTDEFAMQEGRTKILAKVGLINKNTSSIVDKNYRLNLECDRLRADLELRKRVALSFEHDASILCTDAIS
jgi:hypothetical protein